MKSIPLLIAIAGLTWSGLWFTPDQQGQRRMKRGDFQAAAETFRDPLWQGVAWFRGGEFDKAEQAFARVATPEAEFNRGNCLVMLGKYEAAVARYDRATRTAAGLGGRADQSRNRGRPCQIGRASGRGHGRSEAGCRRHHVR